MFAIFKVIMIHCMFPHIFSQIYFKSEDEKPLAILQLKVEPQPHVIDQTFRFHCPEQTFLKKSIRLPPLQSLPGNFPKAKTLELQIKQVFRFHELKAVRGAYRTGRHELIGRHQHPLSPVCCSSSINFMKCLHR